MIVHDDAAAAASASAAASVGGGKTAYRFLYLIEVHLRLWLVNAPAYVLQRYAT
jgi:hypothetical protein